jgi:hypothetical protein
MGSRPAWATLRNERSKNVKRESPGASPLRTPAGRSAFCTQVLGAHVRVLLGQTGRGYWGAQVFSDHSCPGQVTTQARGWDLGKTGSHMDVLGPISGCF